MKPSRVTARRRTRISLGPFGVTVVVLALVVGTIACSGGGSSSTSGEQPIPIGQQIQPFRLPDAVSGRQVSLADYLGKQDVVIVGYMGFF
ncbi:MAG: hypothetical protein E6J42_01040 [Chloroflexi bacterium]|nr:MAG: hypothetical protein E6J42_01040 [Chloroflexota bacterium]